MEDRQLHKPFSRAYIKQQIAQCSRKATTSTKLSPQGDRHQASEFEANMKSTHLTLDSLAHETQKWTQDTFQSPLDSFHPNVNSPLDRRPIKGTCSNLEKADFVLLKLRRSLKNLVKFYIYNSIHHRILFGSKTWKTPFDAVNRLLIRLNQFALNLGCG